MNNNRKKKTQTQTPGEERLKSFLEIGRASCRERV